MATSSRKLSSTISVSSGFGATGVLGLRARVLKLCRVYMLYKAGPCRMVLGHKMISNNGMTAVSVSVCGVGVRVRGRGPQEFEDESWTVTMHGCKHLLRGSIHTTIVELGGRRPSLQWVCGTYVQTSSICGPSWLGSHVHAVTSGPSATRKKRLRQYGVRVCRLYKRSCNDSISYGPLQPHLERPLQTLQPRSPKPS